MARLIEEFHEWERGGGGDANIDQLSDDSDEEDDRTLTDPFKDCEWLSVFSENFGARNIDNKAIEYEIFANFFDEVIDTLVAEMNRYFAQVMGKKAEADLTLFVSAFACLLAHSQ